jgi:cupin 2 domain-containing protein
MNSKVKNLFAEAAAGHGESFLTLFDNGTTKIERIVSRSHASPKDFWYDQADDEWVVVLGGDATLEFADGKLVEMRSGDYLTIPRHVKHRVARTSAETIWLAVHLK